jgi:MFS family permease
LAELRALFRRTPAFRRLLWADVATQLGDGGLLVAFPLLILDQTGDVTLTGLAFSGEILAFGLLSPMAGVWADRFDQKRLMIAANLARISIFALLLLALAMRLPTWAFISLSLALGAAGAFFMPARAAFMRRLLEKAELEQAIALEGTLAFLIRLIAPALMGLLLAVYPPHLGIVADMAAYGLAVLLLLPAWVSGRIAVTPEAEAPGAWKEGWRTLLESRPLRTLLGLDVGVSLAGMAAFSLTLAFIQTVLHLPAHHNGWLLASTGLAGAAGAWFAGRLRQWSGIYAALTGAIALTYLLVPISGSLGMMMGFWMIRGLAVGALSVLINQTIAREVPAAVMGRVQAAWGLAACLAAFVGSAMTPLLLRVMGASAAYLFLGGLVAALAVGMIASAWARRWKLLHAA